ncbi:MAG TPA: 8-oxoguanine deaminase [Candidatus Binatia bacterium]|nr:8-oxoguanine deaminase [Candidatus Binatia bacterium]
MSQRTVLRGARWPGDLAVESGRVVALGTVDPLPGDRVLPCDGCLITAGLVNTHHHLYQWMTRGRSTSRDLFNWLTELYPVWARLTVEDVAAAATVGLAELAAGGTTTVADHHYVVPHGDDSVFDAIAAAARAVGVRLHLCRGSMDLGDSAGGLPPDTVVESIDAILASTEAVAARLHDGEWTTVAVAPCSPFSVSTDLMRESAALARHLRLRLHTHLAETVAEERDCLARFGKRPLELVEELGWLADDVWFAHGIHFDAAEVRRIGQAGAGVAHCPSSNARLASGICPVRDLLDAGAPVGLGVDGAASNEMGVLLPEMRQALYFARQRTGCPEALTSVDALEMATFRGAACLGRADLGRLEVGAPADIAVWPAEDIADIPDPVDGLVLGPDRRVRHLLVGGKEVVVEGAVLGIDLGRAHADLAARSRKLWG